MSLLSIPVGLGLAFNAPTAAPFGAHHRVTSVRLAAEAPEPITEVRAAEVPTAPPPAPPPPKPKPLIETIYVGGNQLAGDVGFDPLQLAEDSGRLAFYREAEVKHARLAMLCAVGWPLSELLHGPFAGLTGGHSLLAETSGKAPSVLNGGLGQVDGLFWILAFGLAAAVEINSLDYQFEGWQSAGKPWTYEPGELNFDPLGLRGKWGKYSASRVPRGSYPVDDTFDLIATCTKNVDKAEMAHGRVAMLAVLGYAVQEFVWGVPVVDQTPIFFATPLYNFIGQILNN